jgi:benzoylformate decarboxylase
MWSENRTVDEFVRDLADGAPRPPFGPEEARAPRPGPVVKRIKGTGGDVMFAQMRAAGVKYLFTNPGSYEAGLYDALLDQSAVKLIMGLHEGIVIAMADGYHKVSGEPGFVNLHAVAGTAQAVGQLYNARRDGSALVVTAGLLDNEVFSDSGVLRPAPGFNQKDVVRPFVKMGWEAHDPRGLATMLRRAFKVASAAPAGPVYLAVPNTVLEAANVTADVYDRRHFLIPDAVPPNPGQVEEVARLLLEARAPALILGDEVAKANAQPEALELAELLGLPVYEGPLPGFHSFPRHHALFDGDFLAAGKSRGKDLVINVGENDLGDCGIHKERDLFPAAPFYEVGTKVVRIGLEVDALGRNNPFDVAVVANVKLALRALVDAVKGAAGAERIARLRAARWSGEAHRPVRVRPDCLRCTPLHPDELGWALEQELDPDAIVVSENLSGSNHFLATGFRGHEKKWVSNTGAGLGWGVGAATGAKLAAPDRQVVCSIGDGSVMYSAAGFWTQARYEVPVLTVVWNNRNYQTVRHAFARYGGKMTATDRFPGMYLGDPAIDFVQLARSQGVDGVRVERSTDLRNALRKGGLATRGGQPFLIEVVVGCTGQGASSTWH